MPRKKHNPKPEPMKILKEILKSTFSQKYLIITLFAGILGGLLYTLSDDIFSVYLSLGLFFTLISLYIIYVTTTFIDDWHRANQRWEALNDAKKHFKSMSKKSTQVEIGDKSIGITGNVSGSNIINGDNSAIYQGIEHRQKRPDLTKLIQIRDDGYLLRNKGIRITDEIHLNEWIEQSQMWTTAMQNAISEIDIDKGRLQKILGNIPRNKLMYQNLINDRHHLKLDIFTERLNRLDKIIEEYLKLPL